MIVFKKIRRRKVILPRAQRWAEKPLSRRMTGSQSFIQRGATLITTLILSGLVLSITLGLAKVVTKDLEFSADFFFGEKAYFAAESGVETALIRLKTNPIFNGSVPVQLEPNTSQVETKVQLDIDNLAENIDFTLDAYRSIKLRLKKDEDGTVGPVALQDLNITVTPLEDSVVGGELFSWGIQCQHNGQTISIQGQKSEVRREEIFSWSGNYDDENGVTTPFFGVSNFWSEISSAEKQTCFLSFQNLGERPLMFQLENTLMTPEKAVVTATGISKNREKVIQFEYLQNNLSSFFNFGLLHSDQ